MSEARECGCCEANEKILAKYPGPWQGEPNRAEFEHAGLPCILHRGTGGAWCGYVAVPPGHPYHGVEYGGCSAKPPCPKDEWGCRPYCEHTPGAAIDVHGGLTYSEKCAGHVCHVAKPGEPDDVWWLGFDCLHGGAVGPAQDARLKARRAEPRGACRALTRISAAPWAHGTGLWPKCGPRRRSLRSSSPRSEGAGERDLERRGVDGAFGGV